METDRLIVPPKYDKPYQAELKLRKEASEREVKSATLLKALVLRVTKRLKTPKLLGRAGTPSLRVMKPLPPEIESMPLVDADLGEWIFELENLLHTSLGGPRRDPGRAAEAGGTEAEGEHAGAAAGERAAEGEAELEEVVEGFEAPPEEAEGAEAAEASGEYAEGVQPEGMEAAGAPPARRAARKVARR